MNQKVASIISNVFNAYFTAVVSTFLIVWLDRGRIPNWEVIVLIMLVLMFLQVYLFRKFNLISDLEISNRKQRPLFNLAAAIPQILLVFIATTTNSALFLSIALIHISLNLILGLVSIFWKISGHTTYVSLLATITTFIFFNWYILVAWLVIIGLVAWSRVVLKKHSVLQTIGGIIVGILVPLMLL